MEPASDSPASGLAASGLPASEPPASEPPASGLPASGLPASGPATSDPAASNLPAKIPDFQDAVRELGREIFRLSSSRGPKWWSAREYWSDRMMGWSMTKPSLRADLFRLVDVLPSLSSSADVAEHVRLYLGSSADALHPLLGRGVRADAGSLGSALVAAAVRRGVREMASRFIAGEGPAAALGELRKTRKRGFGFTVDLLGEYCVSEEESEAYLARYLECLTVLGDAVPRWREAAPLVPGHPGERSPVCVSVKLSALYSQCDVLNMTRSVDVLSSRLGVLAAEAKRRGALLYVDAEDSAHNPVILETFEAVFGGEHSDFVLPGIVVQAYAKDAGRVVERLAGLAGRRRGPVAVRLVKGAYWDQENEAAARSGWPSPLHADKGATDAAFEQIAARLLDDPERFYPAFGSHNVRSLSFACAYAEKRGVPKTGYELQMLYGMAGPLAAAFSSLGHYVRLYVPLGELLPGMGYLVRRLLENTSNESFLRQSFFDGRDRDALLDPPRPAAPDVLEAAS